MKLLTKDEFTAWLAAYPRPLSRNVCGIVEPPVVTWNDFEKAPMWPQSVVARKLANSDKYEVVDD